MTLVGKPVGRWAATPAMVASGGRTTSKERGVHWVRGGMLLLWTK